MRSDMHDVITDRPRHNSGYAKSIRGTRRRLRNTVERDGEGAPSRFSMRVEFRGYSYLKSFRDHLTPLERWMDKQVGRPWADIYADFSRAVSGDLAAWHLSLHVEWMVSAVHWVNPAQTGVAKRDQSRRNPNFFITRTRPYFVHPQTGLLCRRRDIEQLMDV